MQKKFAYERNSGIFNSSDETLIGEKPMTTNQLRKHSLETLERKYNACIQNAKGHPLPQGQLAALALADKVLAVIEEKKNA